VEEPPPFRLNGPEPRSPGVARAQRLYEAMHWGIPPKRTRHVRTRLPRHLAELGRLESVVYSTNKKGDGPSHYEHSFGEEGGAKPRLAVDAETRDLVIVGGDYDVQARGIVD
jgi:hypothetical protein